MNKKNHINELMGRDKEGQTVRQEAQKPKEKAEDGGMRNKKVGMKTKPLLASN